MLGAHACHAAGVEDSMIQLICRWMCPESLHVYRRMGVAEHETLIRKALGGTWTALSRSTFQWLSVTVLTTETQRHAWAFRIILQIRVLEGMHWRWGKGRASQGMVPRSAQFRARGDGVREIWGDEQRKGRLARAWGGKGLDDKTAAESDSVSPKVAAGRESRLLVTYSAYAPYSTVV